MKFLKIFAICLGKIYQSLYVDKLKLFGTNRTNLIPSHLFSLWNSEKNRPETEEVLYINAYKMMTFFEEAVDTLAINKYNLQGVQLTRINKKEFYFTVPVINSNKFSNLIIPLFIYVIN